MTNSCDRSGGHVRVAFDWALRLAKPRLFYEEGSLMADLLALCPVLYKDYAPPLVSMNGGMHMVLSVGEPLFCMRLISCCLAPHPICVLLGTCPLMAQLYVLQLQHMGCLAVSKGMYG